MVDLPYLLFEPQSLLFMTPLADGRYTYGRTRAIFSKGLIRVNLRQFNMVIKPRFFIMHKPLIKLCRSCPTIMVLRCSSDPCICCFEIGRYQEPCFVLIGSLSLSIWAANDWKVCCKLTDDRTKGLEKNEFRKEICHQRLRVHHLRSTSHYIPQLWKPLLFQSEALVFNIPLWFLYVTDSRTDQANYFHTYRLARVTSKSTWGDTFLTTEDWIYYNASPNTLEQI